MPRQASASQEFYAMSIIDDCLHLQVQCVCFMRLQNATAVGRTRLECI